MDKLSDKRTIAQKFGDKTIQDKKYDDEYKQYNPKIIKKRRVLRKNMKNMEKVKEDEFSNTFTNFNKSPKTNIKMKEYLNDEDDDEPKNFKTPNNQIKTRKYFKSQKKEMQHKDEYYNFPNYNIMFFFLIY